MPGTNGGSQDPQNPGKSTSSHPKGQSHPSSKGQAHHPKPSTHAQTTQKTSGRKEVQFDEPQVVDKPHTSKPYHTTAPDSARKEHEVQISADKSPQSSKSLPKSVKVQEDAGKELRVQYDEPRVVKKPHTSTPHQGSPARKSSLHGGSSGVHNSSQAAETSSSGSETTKHSRLGLPGIISRKLPGTSRRSSETSRKSPKTSRRPSETSRKSSETSRSSKAKKQRSPRRRSRSPSRGPPSRKGSGHSTSSTKSGSSSTKSGSSSDGSYSKSHTPSGSHAESPRKSRPKPQTGDESEERPRVSFGYAVAFQEASAMDVEVEVLPVKDSTESSKGGKSASLPSKVQEPSVEPNDENAVHGILHNKNEKPLGKPPQSEGMLDATASISTMKQPKRRKSLEVVLHEQFCTPRIITYILGVVIIVIVVVVITVLIKLLRNV